MAPAAEAGAEGDGRPRERRPRRAGDGTAGAGRVRPLPTGCGPASAAHGRPRGQPHSLEELAALRAKERAAAGVVKRRALLGNGICSCGLLCSACVTLVLPFSFSTSIGVGPIPHLALFRDPATAHFFRAACPNQCPVGDACSLKES